MFSSNTAVSTVRIWPPSSCHTHLECPLVVHSHTHHNLTHVQRVLHPGRKLRVEQSVCAPVLPVRLPLWRWRWYCTCLKCERPVQVQFPTWTVIQLQDHFWDAIWCFCPCIISISFIVLRVCVCVRGGTWKNDALGLVEVGYTCPELREGGEARKNCCLPSPTHPHPENFQKSSNNYISCKAAHSWCFFIIFCQLMV